MAHDLFKMLHNEHQEVTGIFRRLTSARSEQDRRSLLDRLRSELLPHMQGEEETIYPVLADKGGEPREAALEAIEEHLAARHLLDQIEMMSLDDDRFKARVTVLMEMIKHHIGEEEGRLFGELEDAFSDREIERLHQDYMDAKETAKAAVV